MSIEEKIAGLDRSAAIEALYLAVRYLTEPASFAGTRREPDIKDPKAANVAREIVRSIEHDEGIDLTDLRPERIAAYTSVINKMVFNFAEKGSAKANVDSILSELRSIEQNEEKPSAVAEFVERVFKVFKLDKRERSHLFSLNVEDTLANRFSDRESEILDIRLAELKFAYREFKTAKDKSGKGGGDFFLSADLITTVCLLYLSDLRSQRDTLLNDNNRSNNLLLSSSLSRWIAKLRPIQVEHSKAIKNEDLLFLNEDFATYIFFMYLDGFGENTLTLDSTRMLAWRLRHIFHHGDPQLELMNALAFVTQELLQAGREES